MASEPFNSDEAARNMRRLNVGIMVSVSQLEEVMQLQTNEQWANEADEIIRTIGQKATMIQMIATEFLIQLSGENVTIPTADSLQEEDDSGG